MSNYPCRPPRAAVSRPALVNLEDGQWLACLIRNVSRQGACITMINADLHVDHFELEDKFTRERWQAEVRWRGLNRVGVRLRGRPPSMAPATRDTGFGRRH